MTVTAVSGAEMATREAQMKCCCTAVQAVVISGKINKTYQGTPHTAGHSNVHATSPTSRPELVSGLGEVKQASNPSSFAKFV